MGGCQCRPACPTLIVGGPTRISCLAWQATRTSSCHGHYGDRDCTSGCQAGAALCLPRAHPRRLSPTRMRAANACINDDEAPRLLHQRRNACACSWGRTHPRQACAQRGSRAWAPSTEQGCQALPPGLPWRPVACMRLTARCAPRVIAAGAPHPAPCRCSLYSLQAGPASHAHLLYLLACTPNLPHMHMYVVHACNVCMHACCRRMSSCRPCSRS